MLGLLLFLVSLPYIAIQWAICLLLLIPILIAGLIAVPVGALYKEWPRWLWLFGNEDEPRYGKWWDKVKWYGYRNPVANLRKLFKEPKWVCTFGATDSMDAVAGWQIRWRFSVFADSIRITGGKPDKSKGKKELYFGWKLRSKTPGVGFATSIRMPWYYWAAILTAAWNTWA